MQEVTGIYVNNFDSALNTKNGFPVFATVVEANYVTKKQDLFSALRLTDEDKSDIEKLSKDPRIGQRVWTLTVSILWSSVETRGADNIIIYNLIGSFNVARHKCSTLVQDATGPAEVKV